jgi:hypothetical protein
MWDMAAAVARCGWQSLRPVQALEDAAGEAAAAAGTTAEQQQQQGGKKKRSRASSSAAELDAEMAIEAADVDLSGMLPPPVDIRRDVVQKMAKKQLKEVQLQLELLTQLLHALTAPFDAAVAVPPPAAAGPFAYRSGVPVAAWKGLQLACYLSRCFVKLWEGPQQRAVQQVPQAAQLLVQLQQLQQRWELELLQRHVYCSLNGGLAYCLDRRSAAGLAAAQRQMLQQGQQPQLLQLPAAGGASTGAAAGAAAAAAAAAGAGGCGLGMFPVSEVLMADWVSLNIRSPDLNGDELLRPAAVVYASYSLPAPLALDDNGGSSMPSREANPLDAEELPPVGVSGSELQAMQVASVEAEAAVEVAATADGETADAAGGDVEMTDADSPAAAVATVSWPRCAASLLLCPVGSSVRNSWGCSCCGRRYSVLPCRGIVAASDGATSSSTAAAAAAAGGVQVLPCVPHCLVCSCRLFPGGAGATGLPGGTAGVQQVLDGSPVLGVGMSLTDVVLPGV